ISDALLDFVGILEDIEPGHRRGAGSRRKEASEDPHGGGLAGAVRPQKTDDLALLHLEGKVVKCGQAGRPVPPERSKPKRVDLKKVVGDGWLCALCSRGQGSGAGSCLEAGGKTVIAYPLCRGVRLSKIRGGSLLTAIGGCGGAKERMVLCGV